MVPVALDTDLPSSSADTVTKKTIVQNTDGTQTVTEETSYPDGRVTRSVTTIPAGAVLPIVGSSTPTPTRSNASAGVPTGVWRHDLFSCFEVCDNGMFWMSWCCTYIALGQLLQRMKMNVCGQPGDYSNTCMIWTIIWIVAFVLFWIIVGVTEGWGVFLYTIVAIFAIVALTQVRYFMRRKWSIPADCCQGNRALSDCCCVWWCTCCSIIQMMRHTHDERVDRYNCGSATGLSEGAPDVV